MERRRWRGGEGGGDKDWEQEEGVEEASEPTESQAPHLGTGEDEAGKKDGSAGEEDVSERKNIYTHIVYGATSAQPQLGVQGRQ